MSQRAGCHREFKEKLHVHSPRYSRDAWLVGWPRPLANLCLVPNETDGLSRRHRGGKSQRARERERERERETPLPSRERERERERQRTEGCVEADVGDKRDGATVIERARSCELRASKLYSPPTGYNRPQNPI